MSDDPGASRDRAAIRQLMRCLDDFARGLGLDEATAREIVKQVADDMPMRTDDERLFEARARLIAAATP